MKIKAFTLEQLKKARERRKKQAEEYKRKLENMTLEEREEFLYNCMKHELDMYYQLKNLRDRANKASEKV